MLRIDLALNCRGRRLLKPIFGILKKVRWGISLINLLSYVFFKIMCLQMAKYLLLPSTFYSKDSQLHQKDHAEERTISLLNFVMEAVYRQGWYLVVKHDGWENLLLEVLSHIYKMFVNISCRSRPQQLYLVTLLVFKINIKFRGKKS